MKTPLISVLALIGVATSLAQAAEVRYFSALTPEVTGATGSGFTTVTFDTVAKTMKVEATFSGLSGNSTVAHIHGPTATAFAGTAGVMTQTPSFSGFPVGVSFGTFSQTFDMTLASSYNGSFLNNATNGGVTATAFNSLMTAVADGKAYLNVHSSTFGGGEIRGFYRVPEPSTLTALAGAALFVRRRR